MSSRRRGPRPVRWAVAGLGHIAQVAVLPAFAHARGSTLAALLSSDPRKLRTLSRRHEVEVTGDYDELEDVLARGAIDALFVALPNHMHAAFTVRALRAGVHVLCEKPMAVTSAECERMIGAARAARRKLMIAYRLHFERGNLEAIRTVASGKLGDVHHVHGVLTIPVRDPGNIRLGSRTRGGGPLYDLGIYCLNAGRYLFRAEPSEVMAFASKARSRSGSELRLHGFARFPDDRELTFLASVASAPMSELRILGTKGDLRVENAFDYVEPIRHVLTVGERTRTRTFAKRDQFAAEVAYFAECIRRDREPEPSGREGFADVRAIEAFYRSLRLGRPVVLAPFVKARRPDLRQEIRRPAVRREPPQVAARSPSDGS
jgi:predicted dehydrogenase